MCFRINLQNLQIYKLQITIFFLQICNKNYKLILKCHVVILLYKWILVERHIESCIHSKDIDHVTKYQQFDWFNLVSDAPIVKVASVNMIGQTIRVSEGMRVNLSCSVQANPPIIGSIQWRDQDGGIILWRPDYVIETVSRRHAGNYTCFAENQLEPTTGIILRKEGTQTVQLIVECKYYSFRERCLCIFFQILARDHPNLVAWGPPEFCWWGTTRIWQRQTTITEESSSYTQERWFYFYNYKIERSFIWYLT